jgi:hypothetical protein
MKINIKNKVKAIAGMSAILTLCGTTALADPWNSIFLQVDMDGGGGPTQPGFLSWPVPSMTSNTYQWISTMTFYPSNWVYSNQYTPTGAVTITVIATNAEYNIQTNVIDPFPFWGDAVQYSPNGIDRGTMTNETWGPLYEDFLCVSHDTMVGMGEDYIQLTVSNLAPNTNYEVTVWDYDESVSDGSPGYYVAWGVQNPDPYGTNSFQPGFDTLPRLARVPDGGGWPSQVNPNDQEFAYSKSFFVTTDANGSFTVYGWEDDDTWQTEQWVPFNGFAIGVPPVITNLTNITITSITYSNGTNIVLNWTFTGGNGTYTFSVCRTNLLTAPKATWPVIVTGLHATYYTDTNATDANNFYIISSP